MSLSPIDLALIWGFIWAGMLQWTKRGQWLARRRAWLAAVIGLGVDLIILMFLLEPDAWWRVFWVLALSSIGIILRSLANEHTHDRELVDALTPHTRQEE